MKKELLGLLITVATVFAAHSASAMPLSLNYDIQKVGNGLYNYDFKLVLDNHDNSWQVGQSWDWLIFGDKKETNSNLTNFIGDNSDLPVGPWKMFQESSGYHNGPTFLANNGIGWQPANVGEFLSWSGTSDAYLEQGKLLFSTLLTHGGANAADWDVANLGGAPAPTPEPSSMILGLMGLGSMFGLKKRNNISA